MQYIEPLSQAETIEFFDRYISPDSPTRSKLTVYLRAQSSAADLSKGLEPSVLKENMLQLLEHFLQSEGTVGKPEQIQQRLDGVEIRPENQQVILLALEQYVLADLGLEDEEAKAVLEKGQTMMSALWHSAGVRAQQGQAMDGTSAEDDGSGRTAKGAAVQVDNIYEFRAKLPLTVGAHPVRDVSKFEELTSKL